MATINYLISGTKNPSEIRMRFVNGKAIDIKAGIKIFINPKFWDSSNQKIRNVLAVKDRDRLNAILSELKLHIINSVNSDFTQGEVLDMAWLEKKIAKFYNRPSDELKKAPELHRLYLTDFADWWLKEKAPKYKVSANKYLDKRSVAYYSNLNENIKKFEGKNKLKFSDINETTLDSFSQFLSNEGYNPNTAKRLLDRLKFFCARAESENIKIDQSYKNRIFVEKSNSDYKEPYFNELEIKKIYEYDFSDSPTLDNARDNLIIGLWTGLRVSDFLKRLKISNFDGDFIELETKKTKTSVCIPVHWMVRDILKKRNGNLPAKISDMSFNLHIKAIAKILNFDEIMTGGVAKVDPKTKKVRKVVGLYPKHELITSHICRRSFATNIFDKVSNSVLMAICGWKSEEQMLDYIKKTNRESATSLKKVWDNPYEKAV